MHPESALIPHHRSPVRLSHIPHSLTSLISLTSFTTLVTPSCNSPRSPTPAQFHRVEQ